MTSREDDARRATSAFRVHEVHVFIRDGVRRAAIIGAAVALAASSRQAFAQGGATQPTSPAAASNPFAAPPPGAKRVPISKAVFGDAGVIVNARNDGFIEVAAAGPQKTVLLQLRTLAARAWVDSTQRMMKAKVKKADAPRTYRSDIAEYGTNTTMAMTRTVNAGQSEFALAFADSPQSSFTIAIEPEEADVFVAIIRKAVTQSAKMLEKSDSTATPDSAKADSAPPKPKKKKPAAKPQPSTPAKSDSTKAATPKPAPAKPAPAKATPA